MNKKTLLLSVLIFLGFATLTQAQVEIDSTWWMDSLANKFETDIQVDVTDALNFKLGMQAAGRMAHPHEFATKVTIFGLEYQLSPKYKVFGGTRNHSFGRARLHSLFLSPQSPAFPMLGYEIAGNRYNYTKIYGDLAIYESESTAQDYKRVGIHYFDWQLHPQLSLGFGEAFVRDETYRADMYYDALPFVPYYLSKYLPGVSSKPNNALMYGDFELSFKPATFYGELLVNEFPMTLKFANNPPLIAFTLGAETDYLLPNWIVLAEYSQVRNYTYANGRLSTTYSLGNQSLGHPDGDDVENLDLRFSRYWPELQTETRIGGFYRALGENRDIAKWYENLEHRKETAFLDGVVERTYGTKLGMTHWVNSNLSINFELEVGYATNYKHKEDEEGINHRAVAKVTWHGI